MINEALYNKTVNILAQACLNHTIQHGNCYACAVGILVASNKGYEIVKENFLDGISLVSWSNKGIPHPSHKGWAEVFITIRGFQEMHRMKYTGLAKEQIDSTGYSVEDLAKIEYAFETASDGKTEDEYIYNGLMNVIETLDQIHGNTDQTVTTRSKSLFVKQPA